MDQEFQRTFSVTWETVVTVNRTDDEHSDRLWAVISALGNFADAIEDPENPDRDIYMTVKHMGNGPQYQTYVTIGQAQRRYEPIARDSQTEDGLPF